VMTALAEQPQTSAGGVIFDCPQDPECLFPSDHCA
jgi:hypothetical protein